MNSEKNDIVDLEFNSRSAWGIISFSTEFLAFLFLPLDVVLFLGSSWWRGTSIAIFGITPLLILAGLFIAIIGFLQRERENRPLIVAVVLGVLNVVGLCFVIFAWAIFGASAA